MQRKASSKNSGHSATHSGPGNFVIACIQCNDGTGGPKNHVVSGATKMFRCPSGHFVEARLPAKTSGKRP